MDYEKVGEAVSKLAQPLICINVIIDFLVKPWLQ